jgi:hypothetical protein
VTEIGPAQDLLVLAADKDARFALQAILSRHQDLGIRPITFRIDQHPDHDGGCRAKGSAYLRAFAGLYRHALLVFDLEGCGREKNKSPSGIAGQLDADIARNGWNDRAKCLVIAPELDVWVWSVSSYVPKTLGWYGQSYGDLKKALCEAGLWQASDAKPHRPKEALDFALRKARVARSSSIYKSIAEKVSFTACEDPAFVGLRAILRQWFAQHEP